MPDTEAPEAATPPAALDPAAMIEQAQAEVAANEKRVEMLRATIKDAQAEIKTLNERTEILKRIAGAGTKRIVNRKPKGEETPVLASSTSRRGAGANTAAPGFTPPES